MALPFRDRVAQWWVYSLLYPIFDKTFIEDSYACRRGKGQKAAADRLQDMIKQTEVLGGKWYYLKLDIAKYFYRIYHDKLMEILERKIKDPDMLELLNVIVKGDGTNAFGLSICDNVEDAERLTDRGMPIGNLTSQLLANVYLNELDQFCKKVLGTKFYIRYMDDVIRLSQSKEELHEIKERISKFLDEELQLALNKKTCIRPVSMGIQFVGLHIWSTHRTVRKSTPFRDELKTDLSRRSLMITEEMVLLLIFWRLIQNTEKRKAAERGIEYNPDNLVFCTRKGTYIYPRNFTKMWSENLRSMGIDHKRFHDLRHTVATVMLEDGEAMNTVQEQLGHYDAGFTASRYGHVTAKMRNSAAVKLGERLEKVRNPEAEDAEDANSVKKEDTVIPFQEGRKLKSAACKIK